MNNNRADLKHLTSIMIIVNHNYNVTICYNYRTYLVYILRNKPSQEKLRHIYHINTCIPLHK